MSAKRRRRGKVEEHEEEGGDKERWLVSYADMLTVLVGLFIVLYAISQLDQAKFNALAQSLNQGFGGSGSSILEQGSSILKENEAIAPLVTPDSLTEIATALRNDKTSEFAGDSDSEVVDPKDLAAAQREYESLNGLAKKLDASLSKKGLDGMVSYKINERGLVVGLISDELFFVADTAELTNDSRAVIDALTPVLKKIDNELSIEGHANSIPSSRYRSNWELSSDRATQVLRRFVEHGKIDSQRTAAVGFGDARPLKSNKTKAGLKANRRVDIVVLSGQPERVRELIPQIIKDQQNTKKSDSKKKSSAGD